MSSSFLPIFEQHLTALQNSRNDISEVKSLMQTIAEEASAAMAQFKKVRDEYSSTTLDNSNDFEDISRLISTWRLLCVPNAFDATSENLPNMTRSLYESMVKLKRLTEAVQMKEMNPEVTLTEACKKLSDIDEPVLSIHDCHRYVDSHGDVIGVAATLLDSIQLQTQVLYQSWLNMDLNDILPGEAELTDEVVLDLAANDQGARSPSSPYSVRASREQLNRDNRQALMVYLKLVSRQPDFLNGLIRNGISKARGRFWRRSLNDALGTDDNASPISSTVAWIAKMLKSETIFAKELIFRILRSNCFCLTCGTGYNEPSAANSVCEQSIDLSDQEFSCEKDYLIYLIDTELIETIDGVLLSNASSGGASESVSDVLINRLSLNRLVEEQVTRVSEILRPTAQLAETLRRVQLSINDAYDSQLDDICARIQKVSHANLFSSPIVTESLMLMRKLKEVPYNCDLVNMTCDRILNILIKVAQRNDLTTIEQIQLYDYISQSIKELNSPFSSILETLINELSETYTKSSTQAYLANYHLDEHLAGARVSGDGKDNVDGEKISLDEDQLFSQLYLFYQSTFADKFIIPELNKLRRELAVRIQSMIRVSLNSVYQDLHSKLSETYSSNLPSSL